jgi:hypothetical protein
VRLVTMDICCRWRKVHDRVYEYFRSDRRIPAHGRVDHDGDHRGKAVAPLMNLLRSFRLARAVLQLALPHMALGGPSVSG